MFWFYIDVQIETKSLTKVTSLKYYIIYIIYIIYSIIYNNNIFLY